MEELTAPPRTLDVQQFAKGRAAELLSLHSALKTRKRKAPPQEHGTCLDEVDGTSTHNDGDGGGGDDEIDDVGLSNTSTSLPRHLRRRTSSYARRRRPLPWIYKKKKKVTTFFCLRPKKRRKLRQKQRQSPTSLDGFPTQDASRDNWNAHQVSTLAFEVGSDGTDFEGVLSERFVGFQSGFVAPMSALSSEANFLQHQHEPLAVQPQRHMDCDMISVDISGANALVQSDIIDDALLENVEVAASLTHLECITNEEKSADSAPQMVAEEAPLVELKEATSSFELISDEVQEDGGINSSQGDKDSFVLSSEDNIAAPAQVASQASQQVVVQSEGVYLSSMDVDCVATTVQAESVQQELVVDRENSVCLRVDNAAVPSCHTRQQESVDLISSEKVHAPLCIDRLTLDTQVGTFEVQDRRKQKKKNICRPLRRLLEFKSGGSLISSDGTRRLCTHVWHAKRFSIERMWGYHIPVGRHGRGHGSRSILRWSKSKALLHDCSFINAIQLHGTKEKIMQVFLPLLELPQGYDSYFEAGERTYLGGHFTTAILRRGTQAFHDIISPVTLLWKPIMPEVRTSSCTAKANESSKEWNLWLWVHAAAFEEAYQTLHDMCLQVNEQTKEEKVLCFSRKGDLGRLDLIGEGSFAVLEKVLFPIYRDHRNKCIKLGQLAEVLNSNHVNKKAVVYLEVSDPRLKENERGLALDPICISPVAVFDDRGSKSKDLVDGHKSTKAEVEHDQETLNTTHGEESENCYLSINVLWACEATPFQQKLEKPVKEKFLSRMRHTDRLDDFGLTQTAKSNRMLERRKTLSRRFTCPVILVKHGLEKVSACGWSLILPLSWVSAFWVPLVFAGGHVIGIRERHWLCTDAGCPSFPEDFPDCKAYEDLRPDTFLEGAQSFCKRLSRIGLAIPEQICGCGQEGAVQGLLVRSAPMSCAADEGETRNVAAPGHGCFVARTSEQLVTYLQMTQQTGLLLFPAQKQAPTKFKGLGSRVREGSVVWRPKRQNLQVPRIHRTLQAICLLRVCLRPFRKGVAKVGAKVYAPTLDDYTVWSCMEKSSGTSVLGMCGSKEAIGYVTSMAPRGSKLSAAIAFCEAIALGLARERQWIDTAWHKAGEVFLMFCNEGSITSRPAFASICIEAGPDI